LPNNSNAVGWKNLLNLGSKSLRLHIQGWCCKTKSDYYRENGGYGGLAFQTWFLFLSPFPIE